MSKKQNLERKRMQARIRKQRQRERERSRSLVVRDAKAPRLSGSQITAAAQSPLMPSLSDYVSRSVDGQFYEALREGIPICDAAIRRLINLTGTPKIIGEKTELVKILEDFHLNVPVNDMQKGLVAFNANAQNETYEQGFSLSEFVANRARDDIERLVIADSKRIVFRRNTAGRAQPWIRSGNPINQAYTLPGSIINQILNTTYGQTVAYNGVEETLLIPDNKLYFSADNENQSPYGVSIFRSMEFSAQILVTLQNSMKNAGERFGDPAFHAHYKGKAGDAKLEERRQQLENSLKTVITAKRAGKSGDITTAGGPDSEVKISIIGHEGQLFQYEIPLRHVLEQIVAKTNLAAWMLGIYWSTTERMATLEVEMALADAKIRQYAMLPEYIRLLSNFLKLRGRSWSSITTDPNKPGDWGIIFETPNVRDLVAMAQAEFLSAEAEQMRKYGGAPTATTQNPATQVPVGAASFEVNGMKFEVKTIDAGTRGHGDAVICDCGKAHSELSTRNSKLAVSKEFSRPFPWPELDTVEAEYGDALRWDWNHLKQQVFDVLKLTEPPAAGQEEKGAKTPFSFDDAQRKVIMDALKEFLGVYDITDPDSPVRWSYMQAYSLGLIRAANLMNKDRPLLDIVKNKEIFDRLAGNGFQLVRDNATAAIKDRIIPAMESGVTNGNSPLDVARELSVRFGDQNASWERLTRTEMNGAAEQAKRDEWQARGLDVGNYINGPRDIHPRCKCSSTVRQVDGKWVVVFVPAPDACPACRAAAEGTKVA